VISLRKSSAREQERQGLP